MLSGPIGTFNKLVTSSVSIFILAKVSTENTRCVWLTTVTEQEVLRDALELNSQVARSKNKLKWTYKQKEEMLYLSKMNVLNSIQQLILNSIRKAESSTSASSSAFIKMCAVATTYEECFYTVA